jgi:hypothetical protein
MMTLKIRHSRAAMGKRTVLADRSPVFSATQDCRKDTPKHYSGLRKGGAEKSLCENPSLPPVEAGLCGHLVEKYGSGPEGRRYDKRPRVGFLHRL